MIIPDAAQKASSSARGYDWRWRSARERYLAKHPFCRRCQQSHRKTVASVIDHIVPHGLYDAIQSKDKVRISAARKLFWDQKNWQPLCSTCHDSAKQRLEKSQLVVGCDYDGVPFDAGSHWHR